MSRETAKLLESCREIHLLCDSISRRAREAVENSRLLQEELEKVKSTSRELSMLSQRAWALQPVE